MLPEILFYRMQVAEHQTLIDRIYSSIIANTTETIDFEPYKTRIETTKSNLDEACQKVNTQLLTKNVHLADDDRDTSILALETYALACSRRLDGDIRSAGTIILNEIKSHGSSIGRKPLAVESAILNEIISKFKTDQVLIDALTTLSGAPWLDEVEQSQEKYDTAVDTRREAKEGKSDVVAQEACKKVKDEVEAFNRYLDVMNDINQAGYAEIVSAIKVIIEETNFIIAQRIGRLDSSHN